MSDTENNTEAMPEQAPKPRARRTRKTVAAPEAAASESAAAPEIASAASEEAPKPKRRTTRAKKAEPAAEDSKPAEQDHLAEEPAPKRARTRAKKTAAAAEEPAASVEIKAEASAKREKPAKAKPADAVSADEKPAQDGAAAEQGSPAEAQVAHSDSGEEAPAKRTRRRRSAKTLDASAEATVKEEAAVTAQKEPEEKEQRGEGESSRKPQNGKADRQAKGDKGHNGKQGQQQRERQDNQRANRNERRQRRQHQNQREIQVPKVTMEELESLKVADLRARAEELGIDHKGVLKAALLPMVFEAAVKAEGFVDVEGILDIMPDGYGFVRTSGYLPGEHDVYVGLSLVRRNNLRKGDYIKGQTRPTRENEKFSALQQIYTVNDIPVDQLGNRIKFGDLTPIFPDDMLIMEHGKNTITARVIDLVSPIGKGQRGLIVSPPKAGKTTVLKDIAAAISANNPEVHLMCLLVDERPEEVTDMQRSIRGEVIASTFDMPTENHITVAELVIERAKRLVENGGDVVILLDSLTRLARAYNLAQPASGRILSGGVDSTALYPPKKFLGAARNIEGGGSLTILASALVETGSKMDEVIFEEFKGTGNMELKLDRYLADRRVFPAIDPVSSGTRREDLLLNPQQAPLIWGVRRILANLNDTQRAMDMLIKSLKQTNTNQEFLIRTAKKAQNSAREDGGVL